MDIDETRPIGIISDTQDPYSAPRALEFCLYVKKQFGIPDSNWCHVGDETDNFWGSLYPKSPEANLTVRGELKAAKDRLKEWYKAFPKMRVAISNHGLRWVRKAAQAEIPSELLRTYEDIIDAPDTWMWKDKWIFDLKHPFCMIHGMDYSGVNATRNMVFDHGMSVVHGHLHSNANIVQIRTNNLKCWGMNVGCLIDTEAYAFDYEKRNRMKPALGMGVVINRGSTPIWLPYDF